MGHLHSVYDTDLHFIIDPISREITSESGKVILMQGDHNSERFTFQMPRYIEGHDMSVCDVAEVHYVNTGTGALSGTRSDVYPIADLQVSPNSDEIVIGSWLVSQNATGYSGTLSFILRLACTVDSKIEYQWFSDVYSGITISKNIYNADLVAADWEGTDVLERWRKDTMAMLKEDIAEATAEMIAAKEEVKILIDEIEEEFDEKLNTASQEIDKFVDRAEIEIDRVTYETTTEIRGIVSEVGSSVEDAARSASLASTSEANAAISSNAAAQSALAAASSTSAAAQSALNAQESEYAVGESAHIATNAAEEAASYAVGGTGTREDEDTDNAKFYKETAQWSSTESKSYAVGGTNSRDNENTDNSKHYSEVAKSLTNEALNTLSTAEDTLAQIENKITDTKFSLNFETGNLEYTSNTYRFNVNEETGNLEWEVV